ncbi:MAG: hypothetical protein FRX49_01501 [Trebouxia sp. A1-2]|nr:MAG: hypothetical protein FRX49_01501 [Trebouxia sp. A1-2]
MQQEMRRQNQLIQKDLQDILQLNALSLSKTRQDKTRQDKRRVHHLASIKWEAKNNLYTSAAQKRTCSCAQVTYEQRLTANSTAILLGICTDTDLYLEFGEQVFIYAG